MTPRTNISVRCLSVAVLLAMTNKWKILHSALNRPVQGSALRHVARERRGSANGGLVASPRLTGLRREDDNYYWCVSTAVPISAQL